MSEAPSPGTRFGSPLPYAAAAPETQATAVAAACENLLTVVDRIGSDSASASWDELVGPLEAASERVEREYGVIAHLHAVVASKQWDEAYNASVAAVSQALSQVGQHAGLYAKLRRLSADAEAVAPQRRRILRDMLADFELAGVGLGPDRRKQFAANDQQLAQLSARFEQQLRTATADWKRTVTDEDSLGTMPADMRAAARTAAGWEITLLDPSYVAYMTHGADRQLRRELALARNARASDLGPADQDNTPLLAELMRLRWEQARLLGYPDPAAMILSRRMAKQPQAVADFLARLAGKAAPHAKAELRELEEFAARSCGIDRLEPWDVAFVSERLRDSRTGLDDAQVRAYFGVDKVLAGLFACVGELFGISFNKVDVPVWDASATSLEVVDSAGARIGLLYLDLYARPTKRGGAWAHGAQTGCRLPAGVQLPAALVNCNFTAGAARLSWDEVVTLFHEFGHALHQLLSKVEDYCASGMNGVEWDAVELPSQFLENFAWRREIAVGMSAHQDTGAPLPDALFAKLQARRNFLPGLFVTRQIALGSFDLELHRQADAKPAQLWERVRAEHMVVPALPDDRLPCSFGHIFAGGYAAGYYGYLWADVLAADAYEMFAGADADIAGLGRRFAAEVLERGGTRDAADNFKALREREPDPGALLRRLGLA